MAGIDPAFTFIVGDLAADQALLLPCTCRVRTFQRRTLIALVGRDARLHPIGPRQEMWCADCGEPPFQRWVVQDEAASV